MLTPPPKPCVVKDCAVEFIELLGKGGAGAVWRGRRQVEGTWYPVAIKQYLGPAESRGALARREAAAMSHLRGPRLPKLYDVDPEQGLLIMEYCEGVTLRELLEQSANRGVSLPLSAIVGIGLEVAEALEAAHDCGPSDEDNAGLVHLDLKPDNVLLERQGVRLLDFGIASTTGTGDKLGTPLYMAPEQLAGALVGPFTDIYALGVLINELAGGALGPTPSTGPTLRRCPALADLVQRCTAKAPAARPPSATHVRGVLRDILSTLDHGLDELRLLYSLLRRTHETQGAPLPRGDDWARFVAAFQIADPGPTRIRPQTTLRSAVHRPPGPTSPPSGVEAPPSGVEAPPSVVEASPTTAEPPAQTPRRSEAWSVSFLAIAVGVAAVWLGLPDILGFEQRTLERSRRGIPVATPAPKAVRPDEPGSVRLRSRHPFRLEVDEEPAGPASRTHELTLPPGPHRLVARCTMCPPGMRRRVDIAIDVRAGGEQSEDVRFD